MDKIFSEQKIDQARSLLDKAEKVVITAHRSPDGDAIGASLAMYHYLRKHKQDVVVIVPDDYPSFLKNLPGSDDLIVFEGNEKAAEKIIEESQLILSLDYNDLSRTGKMRDTLEKASAPFILIDHHQQPADYPEVVFSNTSACSTAEMVYQFITAMGEEEMIDEVMGECIYLGIMTDSGSFRFPNVSAMTHRIAAKLIEKGVEHSLIHQQVYDNNLMNRLKLVGYALSEKLQNIPKTKAACIVLTHDELMRFDFQPGDTEGLVNYALSLKGVNVAAFMREGNNQVKLSLRSKGKFDVNLLARSSFNGGGHKNAAGGALQMSISEAEKYLLDILQKHAHEMDY